MDLGVKDIMDLLEYWELFTVYRPIGGWHKYESFLCRRPLNPEGIEENFTDPGFDLRSLLRSIHFYINRRWWTFNLPASRDLTLSEIYEYGTRIAGKIEDMETRSLCKTCSKDIHCAIHGFPSNIMFDPPGEIPMTPVYLEIYSEEDWFDRVRNGIKLRLRATRR